MIKLVEYRVYIYIYIIKKMNTEPVYFEKGAVTTLLCVLL